MCPIRFSVLFCVLFIAFLATEPTWAENEALVTREQICSLVSDKVRIFDELRKSISEEEAKGIIARFRKLVRLQAPNVLPAQIPAYSIDSINQVKQRVYVEIRFNHPDYLALYAKTLLLQTRARFAREIWLSERISNDCVGQMKTQIADLMDGCRKVISLREMPQSERDEIYKEITETEQAFLGEFKNSPRMEFHRPLSPDRLHSLTNGFKVEMARNETRGDSAVWAFRKVFGLICSRYYSETRHEDLKTLDPDSLCPGLKSARKHLMRFEALLRSGAEPVVEIATELENPERPARTWDEPEGPSRKTNPHSASTGKTSTFTMVVVATIALIVGLIVGRMVQKRRNDRS